jgi:hypothetical protein
MMIKHWGSAAAVICLWAVFLASCDGAGEAERQTATPVWEPDVLRRVTVDEARSLLDFEPTLPSFVPRGALQTPDLRVLGDEPGKADYLEVMYWDDGSAPPGVTPVRIRLSELLGHTSMADAFEPEVIDVAGVDVDFAVGPFGGLYADIMAAWTHNEVSVEAEFYWVTDDDPSERLVTQEMRTDALKMIESMIR